MYYPQKEQAMCSLDNDVTILPFLSWLDTDMMNFTDKLFLPLRFQWLHKCASLAQLSNNSFLNPATNQSYATISLVICHCWEYFCVILHFVIVNGVITGSSFVRYHCNEIDTSSFRSTILALVLRVLLGQRL